MGNRAWGCPVFETRSILPGRVEGERDEGTVEAKEEVEEGESNGVGAPEGTGLGIAPQENGGGDAPENAGEDKGGTKPGAASEMVGAGGINVFDGDEDQEGQKEDDKQVDQGRELPEEEIEDNDVPVTGKTFEEVVGSFGVELTELVGGGEDHCGNGNEVTGGGQKAGDKEKEGRNDDVVKVVDDVVHKGAIDLRGDEFSSGPAGEETVESVDDDGEAQEPKRQDELVVMDGIEGKEAKNGPQGGEEVNRPGKEALRPGEGRCEFIGHDTCTLDFEFCTFR